jgi:hypothetical protein
MKKSRNNRGDEELGDSNRTSINMNIDSRVSNAYLIIDKKLKES